MRAHKGNALLLLKSFFLLVSERVRGTDTDAHFIEEIISQHRIISSGCGSLDVRAHAAHHGGLSHIHVTDDRLVKQRHVHCLILVNSLAFFPA